MKSPEQIFKQNFKQKESKIRGRVPKIRKFHPPRRLKLINVPFHRKKKKNNNKRERKERKRNTVLFTACKPRLSSIVK